MDSREKEHIKLKFGLALLRLLEENKAAGSYNRQQGVKDHDLVDSYLKLERTSGLPKATLIGIFQGRINAASSSLSVIVEALGINFTKFGAAVDGITEADINNYREILKKKRQLQLQRAKKSAATKKLPKKGGRKKAKR